MDFLRDNTTLRTAGFVTVAESGVSSVPMAEPGITYRGWTPREIQELIEVFCEKT